jgi:outer membrane autotransporter protein
MTLTSTNVRCAHPRNAQVGCVKRFALLINATALLYCSIPASVEAQLTPNQAAARSALSQQNGALKNFANTTPQNLDLCVPDELTSVDNEDVSAAKGQIVNLRQRLATVRAGSTGSSPIGSSMNGSAPSFSAGLAGVTGPESKAGPSAITSIPENRWGVFVTGTGEFVDVGNTTNAPGFYLRTGGVTAGVDYRVGSNFAIGLTAGYAHTGGDLTQNGSLDINTEILGLYGTAFAGGFYLDAAVTGSLNQYDTQRTTCLVNVTNGQGISTRTASGSTDGFDLNVFVAGGYDWKTGNLSIGPTAQFQYTYVSVDSFTESGPSVPQGEAVLVLKINDQHPTSILTAFGMKASYDWKVDGVLIKPELRVAWQHEYAETTYSIISSFVAQPGVTPTTLQPVTGPAIGHDRLGMGAGATVLWNERISTYLFYTGEFADNYQSNGVFGGFRVTF